LLAAQEAKPAASPLDALVDSLSRGQSYGQVAVSPDGTHVAWVESGHGRRTPPDRKPGGYLVNLHSLNEPHRHITAGTSQSVPAEQGFAWSPDGKQLAFLSDQAKRGQFQVYVSSANGGPARKLSHLKGLLATPKWSPDGTRIAFLFTE